MTVTKAEYQMCYVIDILETLKDKGVMKGGFDVDRTKLKELLRQGKAAGCKAPTPNEISHILAIIRKNFKETTLLPESPANSTGIGGDCANCGVEDVQLYPYTTKDETQTVDVCVDCLRILP